MHICWCLVIHVLRNACCLHFRLCTLCCLACWTVTHLGQSLHQSSAGGLLECVCVLYVWCQRRFAGWWVCFRLHQTCCSSTRFMQRFRVKCSPTSSSSPMSHSSINSSIKVRHTHTHTPFDIFSLSSHCCYGNNMTQLVCQQLQAEEKKKKRYSKSTKAVR